MGACASKFGLLKGAADAAPVEEVKSRDVNLAGDLDIKDGKSEVPAGDESKRQLLGSLLKENEGKDGTLESDGKLSDVVKKEDEPKEVKPVCDTPVNENVKSSEPVCDIPVKGSDTVVESLIPEENSVKLSKETVEQKTALEEAEEEQAKLPNSETALMDREESKPSLETVKDLAEVSTVEVLGKDKHGDKKSGCEKIEDKQPDSMVEKEVIQIPGLEERSREGEKESGKQPNTDMDKCGDTTEVKTSL